MKYSKEEERPHINHTSINCSDCSDCSDCVRCVECISCADCVNCINCSNCVLCYGLRNKRKGYWVLNKEVSKEEYIRTLKELRTNKMNTSDSLAKLWYSEYHIDKEPKEFTDWFLSQMEPTQPDNSWPEVMHVRYWERRAYALMGWLAAAKDGESND